MFLFRSATRQEDSLAHWALNSGPNRIKLERKSRDALGKLPARWPHRFHQRRNFLNPFNKFFWIREQKRTGERG